MEDSDLSPLVNSVSQALKAMQQYNYQYNVTVKDRQRREGDE